MLLLLQVFSDQCLAIKFCNEKSFTYQKFLLCKLFERFYIYHILDLRSHAVLEITIKRKEKNRYQNQVMRGKLALVDLAGSERASETNSGGQKLRDGTNINRSLLALANCINALGKHQKKGLAYVPYRNRCSSDSI